MTFTDSAGTKIEKGQRVQQIFPNIVRAEMLGEVTGFDHGRVLVLFDISPFTVHVRPDHLRIVNKEH